MCIVEEVNRCKVCSAECEGELCEDCKREDKIEKHYCHGLLSDYSNSK